MRVIVLVCLLLTVPIALAGTGKITWTMPLANEDGTSIPATGPDAIASTTVEYSLCGTADVFGVKLGEVNIAVPATNALVTVPTGGRYCFRAFVETTNETSEYSNVVAKVLTGKKPKAPVLVNIVVVVI